MGQRDSMDDELLDAHEAGDPTALARLLHRHTQAVAASLRINPRWRSVLSPEDILQETYRDVWASHRSFTRASSFRTWMQRIAHNNLRDALRILEATKRSPPLDRPARAAVPAPRDVWDEVTSGLGTPSQTLARDDRHRILRDEIARLPEDYREVVRRRWFEAEPPTEIGRRMARTAGWVRLVELRARRLLAERLGRMSLFTSG